MTTHNFYLASLQMRKTLRYLLGNISDMDQPDLLEFNSLWPQDKYILYQLYQYASKVCFGIVS